MKNFIENFSEGAKFTFFILVIVAYPYFWLLWLLSEDKGYTPNDLIKERWKELWER